MEGYNTEIKGIAKTIYKRYINNANIKEIIFNSDSVLTGYIYDSIKKIALAKLESDKINIQNQDTIKTSNL